MTRTWCSWVGEIQIKVGREFEKGWIFDIESEWKLVVSLIDIIFPNIESLWRLLKISFFKKNNFFFFEKKTNFKTE